MPANFPSNPQTNATYNLNGVVWRYTGTYWEIISSANINGIQFSYTASAPASPSLGDRWVDPNNMVELVYVYDGTSYQWVELSSQAPSGANRQLTNLANVSINANLIPAGNGLVNLGSATNRFGDLWLSANTMYIGAASISASGSALVLPAGSTVGGTAVASATDVATSSGPKVSQVQVTTNTWTVLDDTAIDTAGGYLRVSGSNFVSGCSVIIGTTSASAVTFVSSTELRVTVPALAAGTYIMYVINPDGGTAIRVNAVTASASPTWVTASTLTDSIVDTVISIQFAANLATTYSLAVGSTLPAGLTLSNVGLLSGTVTGLAADTLYTFTVVATDAELQDSPRTFTINIIVSDPYFRYTTLLLNGDLPYTANVYNRDSSTNNFLLTPNGDVGPRPFSPYFNNYSVYFDGVNDYLSLAGSADFSIASSSTPFTVESWVYMLASTNVAIIWAERYTGSGNTVSLACGFHDGSSFWTSGRYPGFCYYNGSSWTGTCSTTQIEFNVWTHIAFVFTGSTSKIFVNGVDVTKTSSPTPVSSWAVTGVSGDAWYIGISWDASNFPLHGYISNLRYVVGTAVYNSNFTPSTQPLTNITNTKLLTCQANKFVDTSSSPKAITVNNGAVVSDNSPFVNTDTTSGAAYFDGTGDSLTGPTNTASAFNLTGDFALEAWIYCTDIAASPSGGQGVLTWSDSSGWNGWQIFHINGSLKFEFLTSATGETQITSNTALTNGQWAHIAIVRNGSGAANLKMFLNGNAVASATYNSTQTSSSSFIKIGMDRTGTNYFRGYIAGLRVVNGSPVYTDASFTPPTVFPSAVNNTQLLTLQTRTPSQNSTFIDSGPNEFLITRSGNATQGTFTPFSPTGWSVYFDGNGDYLSVPVNGTYALGTSDFTFECWYYSTGSGAQNLIAWGSNDQGWASLRLQLSPSVYEILASTTGSSWQLNTSTAVSPKYNTWTHLACVRNGSAIRLYENGTCIFNNTSLGGGSLIQGVNNWIGKLPVGPTTDFTYTGYVSNFRFILGQSLYSGSTLNTNYFTPPTGPITANAVGTSGANVAASITGSVRLLTCQSNRFVDNSPQNTVTINGNPSVQAFSPFAPTVKYDPATHGGSVYFDGSDDLRMPVNSYNSIDANNFSIEAWVYSMGTTSGGFFVNQWTNGNSTTSIIATMGTGTANFDVYAGGSLYTLTGVNPTPYSWVHVVLARTGGTLSVFQNGVRTHTRSDLGSTAVNDGGTANRAYPSFGETFTGYMSGHRFIIGSNAYNATLSTITVPVAPPTAVAGTLHLFNFTNAAVYDTSGKTAFESVGNSQLSQVQTKWAASTNTGAMYFDGANDTFNFPASPNYAFGTGDFTVEFWAYSLDSGSSQRGIFDTRPFNPGNNGVMMRENIGGFLVLTANTNPIFTTTTGRTANTWQHVALVRASGTFSLYVNAIFQTSATPAVDNLNNTNFRISGMLDTQGSPYAYYGYLSNFRVTKYARYSGTSTSVANFTLPTTPFVGR